jgi:hypothetical protein
MPTIAFIRDFQLYQLDIANKTAVLIEHAYASKLFVLISGFYAVDTDHTIYKIIETRPLIFDVRIAINGTNVTNVKLLNTYILCSDASGIVHVIMSDMIIKINNLHHCNIEFVSEFFVSVYENMYIFVSYIVNNTFYIEINALNGIHLGTFYKIKVQDFNFSKKYVYIICDNLVYRQTISSFMANLYYVIMCDSDKTFTTYFEKFYEIDKSFSNVILLYDDIVTDTNYIASHNHSVICIQNKKNVINYENNTANLYHFQLSCDKKYVYSKLICSHADTYYDDGVNLIISNDTVLDVYTINETLGLTKNFSIEGKFCHRKNKIKPCK